MGVSFCMRRIFFIVQEEHRKKQIARNMTEIRELLGAGKQMYMYETSRLKTVKRYALRLFITETKIQNQYIFKSQIQCVEGRGTLSRPVTRQFIFVALSESRGWLVIGDQLETLPCIIGTTADGDRICRFTTSNIKLVNACFTMDGAWGDGLGLVANFAPGTTHEVEISRTRLRISTSFLGVQIWSTKTPMRELGRPFPALATVAKEGKVRPVVATAEDDAEGEVAVDVEAPPHEEEQEEQQEEDRAQQRK